MSQYVFENAAAQAPRRFSLLATLFDPTTIRHLEALGVAPGWRCLEVGGGGGSIAEWLAARVGPTGEIVVTDIDPRHLESVAALQAPQVTILAHNVATDPIPERAYDLIHARLVLLHVAAREQALTSLVSALKPGGWLVVEDFDLTLVDRSFPTENEAASALYNKALAVIRLLSEQRGVDTSVWGRQLYARLRAQRLDDVGMEGYLTVWPGAADRPVLDRPNFEQIRADAVAHGFATSEEIDQALALLDDPSFVVSSPLMLSAWGRRPLPASGVEEALL